MLLACICAELMSLLHVLHRHMLQQRFRVANLLRNRSSTLHGSAGVAATIEGLYEHSLELHMSLDLF